VGWRVEGLSFRFELSLRFEGLESRVWRFRIRIR